MALHAVLTHSPPPSRPSRVVHRSPRPRRRQRDRCGTHIDLTESTRDATRTDDTKDFRRRHGHQRKLQSEEDVPFGTTVLSVHRRLMQHNKTGPHLDIHYSYSSPTVGRLGGSGTGPTPRRTTLGDQVDNSPPTDPRVNNVSDYVRKRRPFHCTFVTTKMIPRLHRNGSLSLREPKKKTFIPGIRPRKNGTTPLHRQESHLRSDRPTTRAGRLVRTCGVGTPGALRPRETPSRLQPGKLG